MNTDCYFEIGSAHNICQDYAFTGSFQNEEFSYAIVADECSASSKYEPVDFGARLLVHSYINQIKFNGKDIFLSDLDIKEFGEKKLNSYVRSILLSIAKLSLCRCEYKIFGLGQVALDCTLLSLITDGNMVSYSIFDDGAVEFCDENNLLHVIDVDFPSGAPFYLSYTRDCNRQERYVREFGIKKIVTEKTIDLNSGSVINTKITEMNYDDMVGEAFSSDWEKVKFVAAISDGYKTYFNNLERMSMSEKEIIKNLFSYKNFNGEFLKRRMLSNKKKCQQENIVHYNDVSVAAIYFNN